MAIPTGITSVTVTGSYTLADGTAATGEVRFTPSIEAATANGILPKSPKIVPLVNGAISVVLAATDDGDWVAPGWTYLVEERINGHGKPWRTYNIQVPAASPTLNLNTATPVVDPLTPGQYVTKNADGTVTFSEAVSVSNGADLTLGAGSVLTVAERLSYAGFRVPDVAPALRVPPRRTPTTALLMQTSHGFVVGGGGTASSDANDTTDFIKGTQAIRVTTAANTTQSQVRKLAGSAMDLTGKMIRLCLKVDDVTNLDRIEFLVGTSSFANFFRWVAHTHSSVNPNRVQSGEWVYIDLQWADVAVAGGTYSIASNGTPSTKTGFTDLQLNVYGTGGGGFTYHWQSIEIVPDCTDVLPHGVVSVTFDDGFASPYVYARPKLDANGQRATFYLIADLIGNDAAYMTLAQTKALRDIGGHEIGGHAYAAATHSMTNGYQSLTSLQAREDMAKLKLWMGANGFRSDNFAYPKGQFGNTTDGVPVDQIAREFFATSRTINAQPHESFPPSMSQRLQCQTGISSAGTTVASILATGGPLDRTYNSGDWLILCLHKVVTGTAADATEISQADFNTLMDGIASKGVPVMPVSDVIRYYR